MSYVITDPSARSAKPRTLHRESCTELAPRAKRRHVISLSNAYEVVNLFAVEQCPVCITRVRTDQFALARAEAWQAHLLAAHNRLVEDRREQERWARQQSAKDAFRAQFEPLRAACEVAWGRPVRFADYTWNSNLTLQLGHGTWHDVGTIYLNATDGDFAVDYVGMNNSTALINGPSDAHALSTVFTIIEGWRSKTPLKVPAEAPGFYRVA